MDYRKSLYKGKGINRRDGARTRASEMVAKSRIDKRINLLDSKRNMAEITSQVPAAEEQPKPKVNTRVEMLAKWKAQKQKALMESKKNQKPVFKVGILQRKATGSPLLKMTNTYADKNFLNPQQIRKVNKAIVPPSNGVLTRARAKAIGTQINNEKVTKLGKIVNNKRKQINKHAFTVPKSVSELAMKLKVTIPESPQVLKRSRKILKGKINDAANASDVSQQNEMTNIEEEKENIMEENKNMLEEKENIKEERDKLENCSEVEVKENVSTPEEKKSDVSVDFVPIHYSPYVNKSRGSEIKSPRKTKIKLAMDVDELIEKEENEFKCRIFSFRKYIECQTKRLLDTCNSWRNVTKGIMNVPEDVEEELLSLYGKTTLLTTDKFMQFQDLINKCENKDPMIKIDDLQGYQDWVAIEVDGLDQAFLRLEERRARNWKEEEKKPVKTQVKRDAKPVAAKKPVKSQGVRSNIREHILAARKMKQAADVVELQKLDTWAEGKSPIKTPKKSSLLLKEVLTSEAEKTIGSARKSIISGSNSSKKRFSGMEIMAATKLAKSLTPYKTPLKDIVNEQTPRIRDNRTPLRSILKQASASMNTSKHCVQFRISGNGIDNGKGVSEDSFQPVVDDEYASFLSMKIGEFALTSPKPSKNKYVTSTPIRRSSRLATK